MLNQLHSMNVLVIDDAAPILSTIKLMLTKFGVCAENIFTTKSPKSALAMAEAHKFDLVICDYNLGCVLNGKQLFEELIHYGFLPHDSVFMLVSGDRSSSTIRPILELRPDEYLLKPFTSLELKQRVLSAIKRKKTLAALYEADRNLTPEIGLQLCDELQPFHRQYYYEIEQFRASFQLMLNRHQEAKLTFETVLAQSECEWAKLGIAHAMANVGEVEQANKIVNELVDCSPNNTHAHTQAANIKLLNQEIPSAIKHIEIARQITPGNSEREMVLVNLSLAVNDFTQATELMRSYIDINKHTFRVNNHTYINFVRTMLYSCRNFAVKSQRQSEIKITIQRVLKKKNEETAQDIELLLAHYALITGNYSYAVNILKKTSQTHEIKHFYTAYHYAWLVNELELDHLFQSATDLCQQTLTIERSQILFASKVTMLHELYKSNQLKYLWLSEQNNKLNSGNVSASQQLSLCLDILEKNPLLKHVCIRTLKLLTVAWPMNHGKQQVKRIIVRCDNVVQQLFSQKELQAMDYAKYLNKSLAQCHD